MATNALTLAEEIFVGMAAKAGPENWKWDEMAQSALNAANRFVVIEQQAGAVSDVAATVTPTAAVVSSS